MRRGRRFRGPPLMEAAAVVADAEEGDQFFDSEVWAGFGLDYLTFILVHYEWTGWI